ncbi:Uncharacterised protein [uncultured archaeon]|nr:Uncharacterised protein [uncultured archaeon]
MNYSELDACYGHFAARTSDPQYCALMRIEATRNNCYLIRARDNDNYSTCKSISDEGLARGCGIELRDPDILCENKTIGTEMALCKALLAGSIQPCLAEVLEVKDACLRGYAVNQSEPDACASISVANTKDACYNDLAVQLSNVSICSQISDSGVKTSCVMLFAGNATSELCRQIESRDLMLACLASAERLPQYCQQVTDYLVKDRCYDQYAQTARNATYCALISTPLYRNACYLNISIAVAEPGLCANVVPELERDKCFAAVAVADGMQSACDPIVLSSYKMPCQSDVAIKLDDPSLCNAINSTESQSNYFKDRCYSTILEKGTFDYMKCGAIIVGLYRDDCYLRAARRENNSRFCEQITYAITKQQCEQQFQ